MPETSVADPDDGRGVQPWRHALDAIGQRATGPMLDPSLRVTVHFHPDRLVGDRSLLELLVGDGVYRSQFETGTSNGGLTAFPEGSRWLWENRLFDHAYDQAPAIDRPKYGSLNHRRRQIGGPIRFGSAHLRLAPSTRDRTTFCYPDSVLEPTGFGTADRMSLDRLADADDLDLLDDYIEAHLHGPSCWSETLSSRAGSCLSGYGSGDDFRCPSLPG